MGLNEFIKVGNNIKRYRKNKNISQKEMAEILDVPVSTYSNYENNNREPNSETLKKIANVLGVTVGDLIGNEEKIKLQFKDDFDINIFEPMVMKYINDEKESLKECNPDVEVSNTLVLQNIVIKVMAREKAISDAGIIIIDYMFAFDVDDRFITGKELYTKLHREYFKEYAKDKVDYIIKYKLNGNLLADEINTLKEYYENSHEREIPKEVLKFIK